MPKTTSPDSESRSSRTNRSKELLIIENNDVSRESNLARLFAKQSTQGSDQPSSKICRLPQNSVLSKVMGFLPQMKKANDEMNAAIANGANFDIENVDESEQVIEMNLAFVEQDDDSEESESDKTGHDSNDSELENEDCRDSNSELENENDLPRTKNRKKLIEEVDSSTTPTING